jgi:glutaredoxin 3
MSHVTIYTKDYCPYCLKAKQLLDRLGHKYEEIDIGKHPELVSEVVAKSGGRKTVPQIFIGDRHIGGCDDLYALHDQGGLKPLLEE